MKRKEGNWGDVVVGTAETFCSRVTASPAVTQKSFQIPVVSPASFLTRSNWQLPQQGSSLSTANFQFPLLSGIFLFDFVGVVTRLLTCMYPFSAPRPGRLRAGRHHH